MKADVITWSPQVVMGLAQDIGKFEHFFQPTTFNVAFSAF